MKIKVTVEMVFDSDAEGWAEHGKPFGLTKERYLKDCASCAIQGAQSEAGKGEVRWIKTEVIDLLRNPVNLSPVKERSKVRLCGVCGTRHANVQPGVCSRQEDVKP